AASEHPIRYAEVRVTNASGTVIQCARTSDTGTFSFALPQGSETYTVSVNSRSGAFGGTTYLNASVMNAPERKGFYSLTATATPTSAVNLGTLTATATGEILGAAFNILDQMVETTDYLRDNLD